MVIPAWAYLVLLMSFGAADVAVNPRYGEFASSRLTSDSTAATVALSFKRLAAGATVEWSHSSSMMTDDFPARSGYTDVGKYIKALS